MDICLVGGAVRDELLGRPIKERDWVVVGGTPQLMEERGYKPVGKDFPVFLHPKSKEEYALARTERKSGKGYKGFICYAAPDVTLLDDLKRRDLTINAMAKTLEGELIDPYHGEEDIKNKWLRHVSPAFIEDPLRVLRVARFAATLADFKVHPDTLKLMQSLSESGELLSLTPDRIWKELEKALKTQRPIRFFEVLQDCCAMPVLFPEIKQIDILNKATNLSDDPLIRLSALLALLNENEIHVLAKRISIPTVYQELAILVSRYYPLYERLFTLSANEVLALLKKTDAFRRPERFREFLLTCEMLNNNVQEEKKQVLDKILSETLHVKLQPDEIKGISGKAIGDRVDQQRKEVIQKILYWA